MSLHSPEYRDLVMSHPALLSPSFQKGTPIHSVYHRIDTAEYPPAKAKRRPIIADSEKARKGKEAWDKMEEDGVIEKVKP